MRAIHHRQIRGSGPCLALRDRLQPENSLKVAKIVQRHEKKE